VRWLALALVFFGGPLSSVVHQVLVRHAVCSLHGELIHDDGAAPERRAGADTAFEVAGASARHGHDHCQVLSLRPQGIGVAPAAAAASVPAGPGASDNPATAVRLPHPVPLLLLAPKSSPPA